MHIRHRFAICLRSAEPGTLRPMYRAVKRRQIADTKTRVYLRLMVSCGVLWCANLLTDRVIQSLGRPMGYVRDVGVAGSNPVTPTIDFLREVLVGRRSGEKTDTTIC